MKQFYIPFSGFYNSIHDSNIDDAVSQICENRNNGYINQGLSDYLSDNINYRGVFIDYAREYVDNFAAELNIKGLKFIELDSPREYNFVTDRILCECSDNEFYRMLKLVKGDALDSTCRKNLTSRSGFSSFYDPNYKTWGNWKTWDNNQLSQVIEVYVQSMGDEHGVMFDEYESMVSSIGNSVINNIICNNAELGVIDRVCKIADYLTARDSRRFK
jgi:hypothetical protein